MTSNNELKFLLNEEPVSDGIEEIEAAAETTMDEPKAPSPSTTVLEVDQWNLRRGRELAQTWDSAGIGKVEPEIACDAHASLFEPTPTLAENPADQLRAKWWQQLLETPEYAAVHSHTVLDTELSSIAARDLCEQWMRYQSQQQAKNEDNDGDNGKENIQRTIDRIRSVTKAMNAAKESIEVVRNLAESFGAGTGMPDSPNSLNLGQISELFKKVRRNELLRKILMMAGKFRALCRSIQNRKNTASSGEIHSVALGGDIARLTPCELAQAAGLPPELHLLSLYRLATRRMLCYQHRQNQPTVAGPVVVCVDESSSMHGERIITAKAIALTMAWLARKQSRWATLIGFSYGTNHTLVTIRPHEQNDEALLNWMQHFRGGGTSLDVPLEIVPFSCWPTFVSQGMPRGKTDVIIITDANVPCNKRQVERYQDWTRRENVTTYGIVINKKHPGPFAQVCNHCWTVDELNLDSDAVQTILAI